MGEQMKFIPYKKSGGEKSFSHAEVFSEEGTQQVFR